jgi:3-oxoacyl-[acyl-carrier-protein] synthase-3
MAAGILGTGAYLPDKLVTNDELSKRFNILPEDIIALSGVRQRHIAASDQACSDLAIAAALQALENAATAPDEIGMVIVATSTGDYPLPATAAIVQRKLGIPAAGCFDLNAGCSGFVFGLLTGFSLVSCGICTKVLLVGSEVLSRYVNPSDRDSSILFGDGAGAVVIGQMPQKYGLVSSVVGTNGVDFDALMIQAGGSRLPAFPQIIDHKLEYVTMDGNRVFMFAMRILGDSTVQVIRKAGLTVNDIDLFIPHQANRRIIEAATSRLNLPLERFIIAMENCGNTSAASIPIALHAALTEGRIKHGDRLVLTGFGAGLSWGSILLRWYTTV